MYKQTIKIMSTLNISAIESGMNTTIATLSAPLAEMTHKERCNIGWIYRKGTTYGKSGYYGIHIDYTGVELRFRRGSDHGTLSLVPINRFSSVKKKTGIVVKTMMDVLKVLEKNGIVLPAEHTFYNF